MRFLNNTKKFTDKSFLIQLQIYKNSIFKQKKEALSLFFIGRFEELSNNNLAGLATLLTDEDTVARVNYLAALEVVEYYR